MGDWKFHCDVLSLPENASGAEIKAAFRKLALRFHPDRNGSKDQFQRINISYRYPIRNLAYRPKPEARPQPPRYRAPTQRAWRARLPLRPQLFAAAMALAGVTIAMALPHDGSRAPASAVPANVDDIGRPRGRCEFQAFEEGDAKAAWHGELGESDCDIDCNAWFSAHEDLDDSCMWRGVEFRRHAARQNEISDTR